MKPLYNQVMANTKRNTWGGSRAGAGRRRRATARRYGETWVRLSMVDSVTVNGVTFEYLSGVYWINEVEFDDYASAAAEFVRRVNEAQ